MPALGTTFGVYALVAAVAVGPVAGSAFAADEPANGSCPNATAPPPPVDTSEVPPPGVPSPPPLPVPDKPVGGQRLGACAVVTPSGAPAPPAKVGAASWVLTDLDNGRVLAAKNAHARHRPASLIKVLTALVTIRAGHLGAPLVATQADADQEGSKVGLNPGMTYTVRQVLTGLIMQSGNDAAHALARHAGGTEAMLAKMNQLAKRLGARDTRAATPSGLDGPGMSTSAYDIALIFRAAMRNPEFAAAARTRHTTLPGQPPLELPNDNDVLLSYPGALGGKTGFTDDARHTYVAAAKRDGRRLAAVLLRGENEPLRLSAQTERLLDYGFGLPSDSSVGTLVRESRSSTNPKPPTPEERTAQPTPRSTMFGTVGAPLTAAAGAGVVLLVLITARKRRARLARRRAGAAGKDHP